MTRLAFQHGRLHPELAGRIRSGPRLLIFDFDGTLAPIAPTPDRAVLPERTRRLLAALAEDDQNQVAIVSGRSLQNLKAKTGIRRLLYVGNHGLTADPSLEGFDRSRQQRWFKVALKAYNLVMPLTKMAPGSSLEFKGPDLSLHYRLARAGDVKPLLAAARNAVRKLPLVARDGKEVLELRPGTRRHKGWAVRRLALFQAAGWRSRGVCLYLGDDSTDEDAFAAIRTLGKRAVGLKVGPGATLADYRLRDTNDVLRFLQALLAKPA